MVTKCVCNDNLFSDMKAVSDRSGLKSIAELRDYVMFGENCKFCLPYVELMLKTGRTEFEPMFTDGDIN